MPAKEAIPYAAQAWSTPGAIARLQQLAMPRRSALAKFGMNVRRRSRLLFDLAGGWAVVSTFVLGGCSHAVATSSSYQYGYNEMITSSRQIISQVNAQLSSQGKAPDDSPAKLLGQQGENIGTICEGNLEATLAGGISGSRGTTPLPADFSSRDYLDGCRAAGQYLLKSGR